MIQAEELRNIINGFRTSRILLTACELDLFTIIGCEGCTSEMVSRQAITDPRATEMLLNAVCALGLLTKREDLFFNTETSEKYLNRNSPGYMSGFHHSNSLWDSWSTLTDAVKAGRCVIRRDERSRSEKWLHPFIEAMHDRAKRSASQIIAGLGLSMIYKALDLGGGPGTYAMEIARQHPEATAFVFDLPEMIALTRNYISKAGLTGRVSTLEGDFLQDDIGSDYDLILVSAIIHSYSPEVNRKLIKKCVDALNPDGIIVIQDFIMDESRTTPTDGAVFAINMLVNTEAGSTYTEIEQFNYDHSKQPPTDFQSPVERLYHPES
jgi:predicted O-methyltransferase YrrM